MRLRQISMTKVILGIHAQYRQIDIPFREKIQETGGFVKPAAVMFILLNSQNG